MGDFSKMTLARELPPAGHYTDRAYALFEALCGARIVNIGTPDDESAHIEGGGLVIDFVPADGSEQRRVVFGFNENGMWIEFDSAATSTP